MINAFTSSIIVVVVGIISLYKWVIIISSLLSWFNLDPYNPIVQLLDRLSRPAYLFVRKFIPTVFGNIDLAPVVIIFILIFLETFISKMAIGI